MPILSNNYQPFQKHIPVPNSSRRKSPRKRAAIMPALFINRDQIIHSKPPKDKPKPTLPRKAQTRYLLVGLTSWLLISFVTVIFFQINIYISLSLSTLFSVFLGWFLTKGFSYLSTSRYQLPPSKHELN